MKKNLEKLFSEASALDQKSATYIIRALEENNLEGFDYLEYKQSLSGMVHLNMDESTRYQSAFVTASTLGLTKEKLLETAHFYKKVVTREKDQFEAALKNKIDNEIAGKRLEVNSMETEINNKYEQIRRLKEEIAALQTKIENYQESINGVEGKIDEARSSFENAHTTILKYIDDDIQKIESFVQ
ncbi:MAG: hypothetical protein AAFV80_23585 [Bacteroidota bacterium]